MQFRRVCACVEHSAERISFAQGDGEVPIILDHDPIGGVLTTVGAVFRFPVFRASCAFRAVGAGRDGNQVLWVAQEVGVLFTLLRGPPLGTAVVGVAEGHHVVVVELAWVSDDGAGVGCQPLACRHMASPVGAEAWPGPAFGDQHLLAGVLAVAVGVCPVLPVVAVVDRKVRGDGRHRNAQHRFGSADRSRSRRLGWP